MSKFQILLPIGFVLSVFLTACSPDRDPVERATQRGLTPESPVSANAADTVMAPNMPAPAAPSGPEARDSAATKPLAPMTKREESASMPEAGQANNHSSPSLEAPKGAPKAAPAAPPLGGELKKSSDFQPKAKKVIWI